MNDDDKLLWSISKSAEALDISRRQFDILRKRADFPRPVIMLGGGQTAYPKFRPEDIRAWRDSRLAAA